MKFLLAVLAIHFIIELINNKRKSGEENIENEMNEKIIHPSEYSIR